MSLGSFSIVFFLVCVSSLCPDYLQNCLTCTAQVVINGTRTALAQCTSCVVPPNQSASHMVLATGNVTGGSTSVCTPCAYNCKSCNSPFDGDCQTSSCQSEFYESLGQCLPCPIPYCRQCSVSSCASCLDTYYLSSDGSTCLPCSTYPFALSCRQNTIITCLDGYYTISGDLCIPCGENCVQCASNTTCLACKDRYYNNAGVCAKCTDGCGKCKTPTLCLECLSGYYMDGASLVCKVCNVSTCEVCNNNGLCIICKQGYFNTSSGTCSAVKLNIDNCLRSNQSGCTACLDGYYLQAPTTTFAFYCLPCSVTCLTCTGPHFGNCKSCRPFARLFGTLCIANRSISTGRQEYLTARNSRNRFVSDISQTPQNVGTDMAVVGNRVMVTIADSMAWKIVVLWKVYILGSPASPRYQVVFDNMVNSIATAFTDKSPIQSSNLTLTAIWPSNLLTFQSDSAVGVSELLLQYFPCGRYCSVCASTVDCGKCTDSTLYRQEGECVAKCADQYYTYESQRKCYKICPDMTYPSDMTVTCEACPKECATCLSNTTCLSCTDGYYLYNRTCLTTCPDRFYPKSRNCDSCLYPCMTCANSSLCLTCAVNFLFNGSCTSSCPDTYYRDYVGMICQPCKSNLTRCLTCQSQTKCLTCQSGYFLLGWDCITLCPDGYYANVNSSCQRCSYVCRTCSGAASNCTTCASGFLLNNSCLGVCPEGLYAEVSTLECKACTRPCLSCVNDTRRCLTCTNTTYLFGYQCLQSCPKGYYPSTNSCLKCRPPCQTCLNETACLSCVSSYLTNMSTCVFAEQCPASTYADVPTQVCLPCRSPCLTCKSSGTKCTSCASALMLTLDYFANTCVTDCPKGLFNNGSATCQVCSVLCFTCSQNQKNCTGCSAGLVFQNWTCVGFCTTGYFLNKGKCDRCPGSCAACVSQTVCLLCASGFYMAEVTTLMTNASTNLTSNVTSLTCTTTCPNGFYADGSTSTCIQCNPPCLNCLNSLECLSCLTGVFFGKSCVFVCPTATFQNVLTNSCEDCPKECFTCAGTGSTSVTNSYCTSCKASTYLSEGKCIAICPDGTFADIITLRCLDCQYPCGTCIGGKSLCTSCLSGYLESSQCLDSCPANKYGDSALNTCLACSAPCLSCLSASVCLSCVASYSLYSTNNTCLVMCPDQFYSSDGLCLPCLYPCLTCKSATFCLSCLSGTLLDGSCDSECSLGYYQNQNNVCLKCDSQCVSCRQQSGFCLECDGGLLVLNGSCYHACPNGTYPSQRMCAKCQGTCVSCTSQFECAGCGDNTYLLNSSCVSYCPNGYYPSDSRCKECEPPCFTCYSAKSCTSCLTTSPVPLYLYQYSCLSSCPSGAFLISSINVCKQCTFPCKTCTNSSSCLSCAYGYLFFRGSCVGGPNCPNGLFVQLETMICVTEEDCGPSSVINQEMRVCGQQCTKGFVKQGRKCLPRCTEGNYLAPTGECLQKKSGMVFPQAKVLFVVMKNRLQLWIEFNQDMFFGTFEGITLNILSQYIQQRRLLASSLTNITPKIVSHSARRLVYSLPISETLLSASGTLELANSFLEATVSVSSSLPLQTQMIVSSVPFYQPFEGYSGGGFRYFGEVLSGLTFAVGLGFLAFNRFSELYMLIDIQQDLYLLGFLDILFPPNIEALLRGFKNSHLYFIPNIFSRLFEDNYREYAPGRYFELSTDVSFLRNAAHAYTGLLIFAVLWGLFCAGQKVLEKFKDSESKKVKPLYEILRQCRKNFLWSYATDVIVIFMPIVLFFGFAQMMDYSTPISKASGAISVITMISLVFYIWYSIKIMRRFKKIQLEGLGKLWIFQKQHQNLNSFCCSFNSGSAVFPYFILVLFIKKVLVSLCVSTMYSNPLFVLACLSIVFVSVSALTGYYLPFPDRTYNFTIVLAECCLALLCILVSAIHFNFDTMGADTKWVLGWLASVCAILAGFSVFGYVTYSAVTKGYERKYLEAEERESGEGEQDSQPNHEQISKSNVKSKKEKKSKQERPNSPTHADNQLITYEQSGSEQQDDSEHPTTMPKLLLKCYKYPFNV